MSTVATEQSRSQQPISDGGESSLEIESPSAAEPSHPVLRGLLDLAIERFEPLIARVAFCGAEPSAPADYSAAELSAEEAERLSKNCLTPAADSIAHAQAPRPFLKQLTLAGDQIWLLGSPIFDFHSSALAGTIVLIVRAESAGKHRLATHLDSLAALASTLLAAAPAQELTSDESRIAQLAPTFAKYSTPREFGYALTNRLCNEYRCEQVSFAMVRRRGVQVTAISGCAAFKRSSPGVCLMRQVMEECLDHDDVIAFPPTDPTDATFPIHRQWSIDAGGSRLCTVPLRVGDGTVAVISLRRRAKRPFTKDEVEALLHELKPMGSMLELLDLATQSLSIHALRGVQRLVREQAKPMRFLITILLILVLAWTFFGQVTYRPLCDATVVSAHQRHMAAPFEGRLHKIHVRAGDRVTAGTKLIEFETYALQLELVTVRAEIAQAEVDVRRSIDARDVSAAALYRAHIDVLQARKASFERKIASAVLRAPTDGMVVQGHFDKRIGQVFTQGQPVLEFAPDDGWEIEVEVPEHIATLVQPQQTGLFVSAASSTKQIPFWISHVDGSAKVIDDNNVFVTRAQLDASSPWIRSGMRGVARINTTRKAVCWVVFHNLVDWTRLHFWI